MLYQLPGAILPVSGPIVSTATPLVAVNQPEFSAFTQRESWRARLGVWPWLENLNSDRGTTVTTGVDWVQPTVDVQWL